jgi:hypothetical protein
MRHFWGEQRTNGERFGNARDPRGTEAAQNLDPERACFGAFGCSSANRSAEGGLSRILRRTWAPVDGAHHHFRVGKERAVKPEMFRQPVIILVGLGFPDAGSYGHGRLPASCRMADVIQRYGTFHCPEGMWWSTSRRNRSEDRARSIRSLCRKT